VRLAGDDELHGTLGIGQQAQQPLGVVQQEVRPLVGRETAGKAQGQRLRIENVERFGDRLDG
jgi:hypothetical protein